MDIDAIKQARKLASRRLPILAVVICAAVSAGAASLDKFKALHVFSGADGDGPRAPLLLAADGNLYGTTNGGGADSQCSEGYASGCGTLFRMTPAGKLKVLYSFSHLGQDGTNPVGPLVQTADGTIYGTTIYGGSADGGTIFALTPDGGESVAYSFDCTGSAPCHPLGGLMIASDGNLYGTTSGGGGNDYGTVFSWSPGAGLAVICAFPADGSFGRYPESVPAEGPDHYLYLPASGGLGASVHGTIIRMAKDGTDTQKWYVFGTQGTQMGGDSPVSPLAIGADGTIYGMTYAGGAFGDGTAWSLGSDGVTFALLRSFKNKKDGGAPNSGFVWSPDGQLVGATDGSGYGSVIKMTTSGALTILHVFSGTMLGLPYQNPIVTPDGTIYGTTDMGTPTSNDGGIYRLTPR